MSAESNIKPSLKDRLIPWYFVMAFAVVFIVNGIFIYYATRTHTGVVTDHAYEKGLDYDTIKAEAAQQRALGWSSLIELQYSVLHFTLFDKQSQPIEGAIVKAYITRPTQASMDRTYSLTHQGDGMYRAVVEFPAKGQWDITVAATWKQKHYQTGKRVVIE